MAFDQNSIPKDLRPLNIVRTVPEDSGIASVTTSGRPVEGFYGNPTRDVGGSPGTIPGVYYPTTVADAGFVGLGFTNAGPGATGWVPQVVPSQPPGVVSVGVMNSGSGSSKNLHFGARVSSNASDRASDDGGDDSVSGRKVKFLCSFGGRIMPRPSDGALRYVGGQTRIISVRREVSFAELVHKIVDTYGQDVVIKYQLPDEDLDALVSVSCPEDLENMMDEYEKLVERASDGSAKLRVFLFSASELESSGVVQLRDLQDSGQRYVEAVNGIGDGFSGIGITRKGSTASAGSTQNSEFSGSEAVDSLANGQGELRGIPAVDALSPSGTSATSQEPAYRLVYTDANPATHADAPVTPMTIPLVVPGPVPSLSAQPENALEKSVPVAAAQQRQMGYDMQQTGVTYPGTTPYVPTYVDPQRENLNRADYVQIPSQMGFPRQLLGTVGPVINQQHIIAGAPTQQFVPALHMTMTPSAHVSMNPNMVPSLIQPQHVRFENYPAEGTLGPRVVHFPVDQGYSAYQHQVPPAAYGWHQIPQSQQAPLSEGQVPPPLVTGSEALSRFDDCLMCQKSLPHAHSDTVAVEQRESPASITSDFNSVYHSLRLDERGRPIHRAVTTGTLGEGAVEQQGASVGQRIGGQAEAVGVSQNVDKQYEYDRNLQKPEFVPEHPKVSVPQGMIGLTGTMQSPYGVFVGAVPQPYHVNATEQLMVSPQYQIKQEVAANKPVNNDFLKVGVVPGQIVDNLCGESPKNYGGNTPAMPPKEDDVESLTAYNHLRQIEGRMENLLINPAEVLAPNEQSKPTVDNFRREDMLNNRVQQFGGREGYPGLVTSYVNPNEIPASSNDAPFIHNIRAAEGYEVSSHVTANATERTPAIGEWKDGAQHFQQMLSPTTTEMAVLDGTPPFVQESSNSLYSNQDPWSLQHDAHFPPPKPSKLQLKKEAAGTKDYSGENRFGNNIELPTVTKGGLQTQIRLEDGACLPSGNTDFSSDQSRSKKGSAEEMIKRELQAVAEGVAASVLQSSTPSNADLSISSTQLNAEFESADAGKDTKDKFEETKTQFPERANFGFPVSDGIGRLQIIKNSDLEEMRELGSGTFGTVYHGKWRGTDVAIKRINDRCFAGKASEQERMRDDFWNEAIKLADLHHPNVVAFYGVVLDGPGGSVATVTEYMVNGSLRNALQKNERNLDKRKRLVIAMDVAFGMEYLHGKNIVHFDLKSDNLLVNLRDPHRPICKVGDLGLSKVKCQTLISGGVRGTLPWMAPELLNGSSSLVSEKVDVFSFGIVMWELLTGEEPYAELHYGAIIGGIVSNTLRPPVPESCDADWRILMERCWSAEPSERPSFTEIANDLRVMQSKLPPKGQNQQSPPSANTNQAKS
ncbi:RAF-like serine/threonine-protein kinase PRAF isoform X1 [Nicotiana sylvestris]|uniref:RAF-like serine/threonine-protein kinase PRAF isoform X1 n=1 Tax=Nicotiana sylvestris TaxID=4096 RepID=UPI00388CE059